METPAKRKRSSTTRRRVWGVCVSLTLLLLLQWLDYQGWFAPWNARIYDFLLAHRSANPEEDRVKSGDILLLEIDDAAYKQCFNSTSPMDATRVSALVRKVAQAGPKVVGVDIRTESEKYRTLFNDLSPSTASIVWVTSFQNEIWDTPHFWKYLGGVTEKLTVEPKPVLGNLPLFLPPNPQTNWGIPLYPRENDSAVRRFPRSVEVILKSERHSVRVPSWAKRVANLYGQSPLSDSVDEVYLSYVGEEPRQFKVLDVFQCTSNGPIVAGAHSWETFRFLSRDRIVLIGGTFRESNDFYPTPIGVIPGLLVNAYAVKSELKGNAYQEVSQPWAWLLDLSLAAIVLTICDDQFMELLFGEHGKLAMIDFVPGSELIRGIKRKKLLISAGVVILVCLGSLFIEHGRYLLGFAGEGFGVLLDRVRDSLELSKEEKSAPNEEAEGQHAS